MSLHKCETPAADMAAEALQSPDSGSVQIVNFGCRLNIYEGEVIKKQAQEAGLESAIIFNSCAVTSVFPPRVLMG